MDLPHHGQQQQPQGEQRGEHLVTGLVVLHLLVLRAERSLQPAQEVQLACPPHGEEVHDDGEEVPGLQGQEAGGGGRGGGDCSEN